RQPRLPEQVLELFVQPSRFDGRPLSSREHESIILPFVAGRQALFGLSSPMYPQRRSHALRHRDGSHAPKAFGSYKLQVASATLPVHVPPTASLQSLLHRDRPTVEGDVFPAQPEYLAPSHSQRQARGECSFERVALDHVQKGPYLFRRGRLNFLALYSRGID